MTPRIAVINGPNLSLLGTREPELYGSGTLNDLEETLRRLAAELAIDVTFFQSNHEGALIDHLHSLRGTHHGVIINPGGLAHSSVALRDAIAASGLPAIEVHLTNIHAREGFRHQCITAGACVGSITGLGREGYAWALRSMVERLK